MKSNTLLHAGVEATVSFDAERMKFVGTISQSDQVDNFYAHTIIELDEEYRRLAKLVKQREEVRKDLRNQLLSLSLAVASGEAKIQIDKTESDQRIGMTIKMLLEMADGAGFVIQERLET